MKLFLFIIFLICLTETIPGYGQLRVNEREVFFYDTSIIHATLVTNLDKIMASHRKKEIDFPAEFITRLADSSTRNIRILLEVTGDFRLEFCFLPPVKLKFKDSASGYPFKSLKLICACKTARYFDQYLLKEYIIYRIYNLLTDKSFRVRLVDLDFRDNKNQQKIIRVHAYFLEDVKDVASRNHCIELKKGKTPSYHADRRGMTLLSIFEYMIGNTDWALSANHNIKFIMPSGDSSARPFAIPFDFDFTGLVDAYYAIPDERLNFKNVKQRRYLGYPRNMEELEEVLKIFRLQKTNIYGLINHFNLLTSKSKEEMTGYLDEFYEMIDHPDQVRSNFITNAIVQ